MMRIFGIVSRVLIVCQMKVLIVPRLDDDGDDDDNFLVASQQTIKSTLEALLCENWEGNHKWTRCCCCRDRWMGRSGRE